MFRFPQGRFEEELYWADPPLPPFEICSLVKKNRSRH